MLDASHLAAAGGGINMYLSSLIPQLSQDSEIDLELFYQFFRKKPELFQGIDSTKQHFMKFPSKLLNKLWIKTGTMDISKSYPNIEIFHGTHFSLPAFKTAKKVLHVYDAAYCKNPNLYNVAGQKMNEYGYNFLLKNNVHLADHIISSSQNTSKDLQELFGINEEKISVIPISIEKQPEVNPEFTQKVFDRYQIQKDSYIYYPAGTLEKRKNIHLLLKVFEKSGLDKKLLISGVGERNFPTPHNVKFFRWSLIEERNAVYQNAAYAIYPSLYEGFGIPIIEAMANNCPIACSETTSVGEISKDAALQFNPEDEKSILDAMLQMESEDLRSKLRIQGQEKLKDYSWKNSISQIKDVYKSILK